MNQSVKVTSLSKMIRTIRSYSGITIDDLTQMIGVPKPTVYRLMNQLLARGVVEACSKKSSGVGRKPVTYIINSTYKYILGVNLDKFYVRVFVTDMMYRIIVQWSHAIDLSFTREDILSALDRGIRAVSESMGTQFGEDGKIGVISVGVTAALSSDGETIRAFNQHECMNGFNIVRYLEDAYHTHVILTKASTLQTIAYLDEFSKKGINDYVYAYIGTGIGAGVVIEGKLYHGHYGGAGEFARAPVYGQNKSIEEIYSLLNLYQRIEAYHRNLDDEDLKGKLDFLEKLDMEQNQKMVLAVEYCLAYGQEDIREEIAAYCREWGRLCSMMVSFYDPQMLVVGGDVNINMPNIYECIKHYFLEVNESQVEIMPAKAFTSWDELIAMNAIDYLIEKVASELSPEGRSEIRGDRSPIPPPPADEEEEDEDSDFRCGIQAEG